MSQLSFYKKICDALPLSNISLELKNSRSVQLDNASGSLQSVITGELAKTYNNIVVIFPEDDKSLFLAGDLESIGVQNVRYFPPSNNKPYKSVNVSDSATLVQRSEVLDAITGNKKNILVTSAPSICEKLISPAAFSDSVITLKKGMSVPIDDLRDQLLSAGYQTVGFVDTPGEIASRGGIFDIYPLAGDYPVRLEFFGDEIESIRHFDPDSQRSISFLDETRIVPNTSSFHDTSRKSLLEYFSKDTLYILPDFSLTLTQIDEMYNQAEATFKEVSDSLPEDGDPLPEPEKLFTSSVDIQKLIQENPVLYAGHSGISKNEVNRIDVGAEPQPVFNSSVKLLRDAITENSHNNIRTWILCDNTGQRDRFDELLGEPSAELDYVLTVETLHEGFILKKAGIAVYTDHQIFNRYHRPNVKKRKYSGGISFKELKDLNIGDFVVHVDYGIGKFAGFRKIKVKNTEQEVVVLKYKGDSVLYVNISSLFKIQKYSGKDGHAPAVTKLGGTEWARKKSKAKSRVKDIARELIKLYAKRKAQKAHAFPPDNYMQTEMEASFIYEETPDQMQAIEDVKQDMMKSEPMDRLVCGDVGFGKTEVAIRAAFKAVNDGKQVAVLVPTTILADQHWKTFKSRLGQFPVNIEMMSRFRTTAEIKEITKKLKEGKVDILIGTHRITSKDVEFKDLGLLVIDEEQRFGVATKEKIKRFRATVDVLTLTATPIPRTLQFSLMQARDLSVINTPPPNRQPVQTDIIYFDSARVQDAIGQELSRGGQVFFIHNRVQTIEEVAGMIRNLVPNSKVRFAHGQMKGKELEKIILDFYSHKFDVLVSTNIVENGIDIANANTILINQAHQFGLSELHQLRGRVGRSNRKAYCYLIAPPFDMLSMESRKRLMALVEFSNLGSGFNIAMRDLDIRGAGDILGGEQSGFISDVGFELYTKILNDAVKELKQEEFSDIFDDVPVEIELPETVVEFDLPALLPAWYVQDNVERLNVYRKLAGSKTEENITQWADEISDRFGKMPEEANNLVEATKVKLFASRLFLKKVTVRSDRVWLICPETETEAGKEFYEKGLMQQVIARIQSNNHEVNIVQKSDSIRIVAGGIPDISAASAFLKDLSTLSSVNQSESILA